MPESSPRPSPLLMACLINHTPLVASLLEGPGPFSFLETLPPAERSDRLPGHQDEAHWPAISLLLRAAPSSSWSSRPHFERAAPDTPSAEALALRMLEMGAGLLYPPEAPGASPLAAAIEHRRSSFLEAVGAHPDFSFPKIEALLASDGSELLSRAVFLNNIPAARALLLQAKWPPNRLDRLGRHPLGYARTPEMAQAMLSLGADPALKDAEGLNALERASSVRDTPAREGILQAFAASLRQSSDPAALADLREGNVAALLLAAEKSPKGTLEKIIRSFKFDVAKLRDPKTGRTPLMAALLGGRLASAKDLLARGCDINAADARGISAAAYLLLCNDANRTYGSFGENFDKRLLNSLKSQIDWSAVSLEGVPLPLQPALLAERSKLPSLCARLSLQEALAAGADLRSLRMPDGASFARAYLRSMPNYSPDGALSSTLLKLSCEFGQADGALAAASAAIRGGNLNHASRLGLIQALDRLPIDAASAAGLPAEIAPSFLPRAEAACLALSSPAASASRAPKGL